MTDQKIHVFSRLDRKTKEKLERQAKAEARSLSSMIARICEEWAARA